MIKVNLLPGKQAKKAKKPTAAAAAARKIEIPVGWIAAAIVFIGINALGAYFFHGTLQKKVDDLQTQIADVQQQILQLDVDISKVQEAQKKQQELQQKISIINTLKQGQTGPVAILDQLSGSLPQPHRLWLTDMTELGSKLNLTGVAAGDEEIARFMRALEDSPVFHSIELTSVTQEIKTGFQKPVKNFSLVANIRFEGTAQP
jgi:type IV pilus assembly protein PilN